MHRLSLRLAPLLVALALSLAVFQFASATWVAPGASPQPSVENQHAPAQGESTSTTNIQKNVLWMFSGIVAAGIVLTALYMLKRQLGAFPENPDWVAPITILRSKDAPDEGAFGAASAHDAHGSHH